MKKEVQTGYQVKILHQRVVWVLEQAPHGNGHATNLASVQELPGQCSQMYDLIVCGVGSGNQ